MDGKWLDWFAGPGEAFNRAELVCREAPRGLLGLLLGLLLLGLALHARTLWLERRGKGPVLFLLRLVATLLLALVVLGPSIELQRAIRVKSRVAVLIDSSRSMDLPEGQSTRRERALSQAARLLEGLGERFDVGLFRFDAELAVTSREGLPRLAAAGARTDLHQALAALRGEEGGEGLAGIVLLSDGADNTRLLVPEDVERRKGEWPAAPIYPVLPGDPAAFRDLAVVAPRFDRFGFVRHDLPFEATLVARGFPGQQVEVTLRQDDRPIASERRVLDSAEVRLPLAFRVRPERPGTFLYSIEARALPGEQVSRNNRIDMAVTVGRDQVRVLLICGRPSWDERFLRQMLKKDPNVDLVSFFILRDIDDHPGVPQDELSLIPFPYHELFTSELKNFDVVLLQNFNRLPFLTNLHLDNLRQWVTERGGGLMLVGGDIGLGEGGYVGSPIEDILPMSLRPGGPGLEESSFSPVPTAEGLSHFVTALEPEREATRELFARLPPLDGSNRVGALLPGAVPLLVHPRLASGAGPMPVLAARAAGRGRTMVLTADTTWYWNFKAVGQGGSNREYLKLWQNAIRWLSQDPSAKYLSLALERERIAPGESVALRVRALRSDYSPLGGGRIRVQVERASGEGEAAQVQEGVTAEDGHFERKLAPPEPGVRRIRAELLDARGERVDEASTLLEVQEDRAEIAEPAFGVDRLDAIARASGGRRLGEHDLDRPPIVEREVWRLGERRRVDLWDNGLVLGLVVIALSLEWWLRRRVGYP